jgi:hypothetical protein
VVAVAANAALDESKGATNATELTRETARNNRDKIMCEVCPWRISQKPTMIVVKIFLQQRKIFPILILFICLLPK